VTAGTRSPVFLRDKFPLQNLSPHLGVFSVRDHRSMTTSWTVPIGEVEGASEFEDVAGVCYDLQDVVGFCQRAEEVLLVGDERGWELAGALTMAAIIRYARCFGGGVRRPIPVEVVDSLGEDAREAHDRFYRFRQNYVAHSVNSFERNRAVARISDTAPRSGVESVSVLMQKTTSFGIPELRILRGLAQSVLEALRPKYAELEGKVLAAARLIPYADLYSRSKTEVVIPSWEEVGKPRRSKR
jgi:hypothetical protein